MICITQKNLASTYCIAHYHCYFYTVHSIHSILKQYWGFDKFRPLQEDIINSVLSGKDTLALLPTGGGKSICFQVPAMAQEGMCLVISPLIALMKDQVYNLNQRGIKATAIYTGMPHRVIDTLLDNCVYGKIKFLYISPERLASDDFKVRMQKMSITLLVVDEAHCVSQWGYDFRPSYLKIAEIREVLKNVPIIALTATATPDVVNDIQEKLLFKEKHVLQKSFVRKNLSYVVRPTTNKEQAIVDILGKVAGCGIVYVRNRKRTKEYANFLKQKGIAADFYHAGLQPNERSKKQEDWMKNKTRIICCTNAFGMGIDKPDVRIVIHTDLAESIEAYFQEAGRAGRDEKKAYAVQLLELNDKIELDNKIKHGYPDIAYIKEVYDQLGIFLRIAYLDGISHAFDFALEQFCANCKLNPVKAMHALKILEQQGLLYISDGVYALSQIKCVCSKQILFKFQEDNKLLEPMVKFILRTSEGVFDDFVPIDEQAIAPRLKISTEQVIEQLHELNRLCIFSYQARKNKPQIIYLQNRVKKNELRLDSAFIAKRKDDFEKRLLAMRTYVTETSVCRTRLLVKYFGEQNTEKCDICDVCAAQRKSGLTAEDFSKIVTDIKVKLEITPLAVEQLNRQLSVSQANLLNVLDYLFDKGKISKTIDGKMEWLN